MGRLRRLADRLGSPSRPDLVLLGLPVVFLVTYLAGTRLFASHALPVASAGAVSATLVADVLFRAPPVADRAS